MTARVALNVEGISHRFDKKPALQDIHFQVQHGEFAALLGLNGAGKTTLISLITRLYPIQSGHIQVFEEDIQKNPTKALMNMGVVFQQRTLDLDLSIQQNLTYHMALHGYPKKTIREAIEKGLADFNLLSKAKDKVRTLSGGQMRAVEITRALLHKPKLLLLDEPTVGLDMHSREYLVEHVHALANNHHIGVLYTTHLVDEIKSTDSVILLHQGQILKKGPLQSILQESNTTNMKEAFDRITKEHSV